MARWFRGYKKRRYYYRRRYRRRYSRLRNSIARSKSMSKTNIIKVESTQTGTTVNITNSDGGTAIMFSLANFLSFSDSFKNISNIYDQFKIVSARFQISVVSTTGVGTMAVCAAYDKTGFASSPTFKQISTYASYKVGKMVTPSVEAPRLVYYLPRDAIESITWFDTKKLSSMLNTLAVGTTGYLTSGEGTSNGTNLRINATMMLAVRGARVDTSPITGI